MASAAFGPAAFSTLRAEEEPWLLDCYAPPPDYDIMTHARSVVVLGGAGSGKSALARALAEVGRSRWLLVEWQPVRLGLQDAANPDDTPEQKVLRMTSVALAKRFAAEPEQYTGVGEDSGEVFHWFLQRHFPVAPERLARVVPRGDGLPLVRDLLSQPAPQVLSDEAAAEDRLAWLIEELDRCGLSGIYVVADGLKGSAGEGDVQSGMRELNELLSTVWLFKLNGLTFKLILPDAYQSAVLRSPAAEHGCFDQYPLRWVSAPPKAKQDYLPPVEALLAVVERRLALAAGVERFPLSDLCADARLPLWLYRIGGGSPRAWLAALRPLVRQYFALPESRPLTTGEWETIRLAYPVQLRITEAGQVFVGARLVEGLTETSLKILTFLLEQTPRYVSRDELYHLLNPLLGTTETADFDRGSIDNAVSRLRELIEPLDKESRILKTERGVGVKVESL